MISSTTIFKLVVAASLATALGAALATLSAQRAEAAASGSPQDSRTTAADADRREIQAVLDRYEKALNASDVDAVIELYADDGVFMPSSAPTAVGIESVRASYEHVFTTIKLNIAFTVEEIVADGSIAFARTGSKGTVTVLADGTTAPEENRELFVFKKEDGVWKIARYMFNKTS